ncbi:MAG: HAD family hydrolase [Acholeplasmataceae bacterium]
MKKYLIACDIDGTLLNEQGKLLPETIETLRKVHQLGHIVVIATGRPLGGCIHIYNEIGIDRPIITDNGASIDYPNHIEFARQRTLIPIEVMKTLFEYSKSYIESAFFSIDDTVYAYKYSKELESYFAGLNSGRLIEAEFTDLNVNPTGMIYLINKNFADKFESWIEFQYPDTLSFRRWGKDLNGNIMYEVYLKHTSKASALRDLISYFKIDPKNTMAFGDGINDLEMIKEMTFGVAMKNGVDPLKEAAYQVTEVTNDEAGLAKYLQKFFNL